MAARASRRSASEPPKCASSVSIETRRRAAALVGAHDLGAARRPRGSRPPTASGACARRSATCRARESASANGRPSRPRVDLALELGQRPLALARARRARAWPRPGSSSAGAHALPRSRSDVALQHVARAAPESIASSARRTPAAIESGPPAHVDRRAGVQHGQRALGAGLAARARARRTCGVLVGRARAHGAVGRRLEPELLGASRRSSRMSPSLSSTTRVAPDDARSRRGHPRSTLPAPSRCRARPSARRDRLEVARVGDADHLARARRPGWSAGRGS